MDEQTPAVPGDAVQLAARVRVLERRLAAVSVLMGGDARANPLAAGWVALIGAFTIAVGYLALGIPQHWYQPLFAFLVLVLGYNRGLWTAHPGAWRWPLYLLNFLLLCLLFKLLIGGGESYPFGWMQVPSVGSQTAESGSWLARNLPQLTLKWEGVTGVSDWHFDLTQLQTVLLLATLIGALFQFQPFASMTALVLLVVSVPTYLRFNWSWVIPFVIFAASVLYLQSGGWRAADRETTGVPDP